LLKKHYVEKGAEELAQILGRSIKAVTRKANRLRLKRKEKRRWTAQEVSFLKENYGRVPRSELVKKLGRRWRAISLKARRLGLKHDPYRSLRFTSIRSWKQYDLTDEEKGYIAGFLDGEGTLTIRRARTKNGFCYKPTIQAGNTNINVLKWLQNRIGGSVKRKRRKEKNRKEFYLWRLTGYNAVCGLLREIAPIMKVKKEQAQLLLDLPDAHEIPETLNQVLNKLRILNRRGSID